jgi:hypothetical protein
MRTSYGVVWRDGAKPLARGKLELLSHALRLDGLTDSTPVTREIAYEELAAVRIGRTGSDRLNGHPSLVLEPREGASISLASVAQPGVLAELAEQLAGLRHATG